MILIASILGGSIIGYRLGAGARGTRLFLIVWLSTFAIQTPMLLATSDNPRHRETGAWDLGYFPFALVIFLVGLGILHAAAALHKKRSRTSDRSVSE